jgi:hypothetical protein
MGPLGFGVGQLGHRLGVLGWWGDWSAKLQVQWQSVGALVTGWDAIAAVPTMAAWHEAERVHLCLVCHVHAWCRAKVTSVVVRVWHAAILFKDSVSCTVFCFSTFILSCCISVQLRSNMR